ncbi:hypothetical protein TWF730_009084 [Orbilia blumenaviensis]|uniref:Uncharacterized protein n=1 Tax=Orbilia blumenaviensis TaxID=1796055 RepID=A0AAV9UYQ6_9PEZI
MPEHQDLIIVGAGWQGIAAAKIYRDLYPNGNFLILDANLTVGGVWAVENLCPGLKTQNTLGTFEYSWYPLTTREFDVQPGKHIDAPVVQKYLQRNAERFGLISRISFGVKVISAKPTLNSGWLLEIKGPDGFQSISCSKLIMATGITSIPRYSDISGRREFTGPIVGYRDLANAESSAFIKDAKSKTITVVGGSKSAHDSVYWNAKAGKKVNWVVQRKGSGVFWMTSPHTRFLGQEVQVEAMATTRAFSFFSPCVWGNADGYGLIRWFLHQTIFGRFIVNLFWYLLGALILDSTGVKRCESTRKALPDFEFQWQASSAGTLNYDDDLYSFIRSGQISIYREDVARLSIDQIHFSNGGSVQTDALVWCSGWKWTSPIHFPDELNFELGLPTKIIDSKRILDWKSQCIHADRRILNTFPYLRSAPVGPRRSRSNEFGADEDGELYTPWCLYRGIAPPNQADQKVTKDIAFLGRCSTIPTVALAEIQALWAIAFLHDKLTLPQTINPSREEAIIWMRWNRLRYPFSHGSKYMDTSFDIIPYFDTLLSDMGLNCQRKGNWWKELWEPYGVADYRDIVAEFKKKNIP